MSKCPFEGCNLPYPHLHPELVEQSNDPTYLKTVIARLIKENNELKEKLGDQVTSRRSMAVAILYGNPTLWDRTSATPFFRLCGKDFDDAIDRILEKMYGSAK